MNRREFLAIAASAACAADIPAPYRQGTGWKPLIKGMSLSGWSTENKAPMEWVAVKDVSASGKYLELAPGTPKTDIFSLARRGLRPDLRAGVHKAVSTGQPAI